MDELKPCPFCGTMPEVSKYGIGIGQDAARCENPDCSMRTAGFMYLETWNTRPMEDALLSRAEAAEKRCAELEAQRWIPIEDESKLNDYDWYLVTGNGLVSVGFYKSGQRIWTGADDGILPFEVTHYCPFPAAPQLPQEVEG